MWWALAWWWIGLLAGPLQAQTVHSLTTADAVLQPEGGPVSASATIELPHRWDRQFPRQDGQATYRLPLPPRPAGEPYAIYIPRAGNQLEVRLNDRLIFQHGELGQADSDAAKPPLWIPLPPDTAPHDEVLTVRATIQQGRWGGLTDVQFGPAEAVRELYLQHYRWRQWGAIGVIVAMAVAAVLATGLWYLQREAVYASFAIAAVTGVLRFADRVIESPPLPWPLWGGLMAAAFLLHVLWLLRFSLELAGLFGPRWRLALRWLMSAGVLAALAAFLWRQPALWTATLMGMTLASAVGTFQVARCAWVHRSRETLGLAAAGAIAVLAGARDLIAVRLQGDGAANFSILPHATMAFVLLMGWLVLDRFARQGRQLRALNESLDRQVREKERELQASYEALRRESEQRAALSERQRIMRDIHDGVGAHLVGLVNLLRKDHVPPDMLREHAHTALDELRMAVDAMHNTEGDLPTLLASMRYRLQDRFNACGITLDWHMDDPLPEVHLMPQQLLQVQRIVLEAFTNILKHAGASRIWVRVGRGTTHGLHLLIDDNGVGMAAAAFTSLGQGLHNMRQRAQAVDAQLDILPSPHGGVRVSLQLQRLNDPRNAPASPESPGPTTA